MITRSGTLLLVVGTSAEFPSNGATLPESFPSQAIWYHVVTVVSLVLFKLVVLVVGYLIARLGYELLVKGVTGQFQFKTEFKGSRADLVSASPGLFFILMAAILIAIGILKDKPFATTVTVRGLQSGTEHTGEPMRESAKPALPEPKEVLP